MDIGQQLAEAHPALHLLNTTAELTGVRLRCATNWGLVTVTVRKTVQVAASGGTGHRFWWLAQAAGQEVGEWVGGQAYETAEAAYQAALRTLVAAIDNLGSEPPTSRDQ